MPWIHVNASWAGQTNSRKTNTPRRTQRHRGAKERRKVYSSPGRYQSFCSPPVFFFLGGGLHKARVVHRGQQYDIYLVQVQFWGLRSVWDQGAKWEQGPNNVCACADRWDSRKSVVGQSKSFVKNVKSTALFYIEHWSSLSVFLQISTKCCFGCTNEIACRLRPGPKF